MSVHTDHCTILLLTDALLDSRATHRKSSSCWHSRIILRCAELHPRGSFSSLVLGFLTYWGSELSSLAFHEAVNPQFHRNAMVSKFEFD